ncbi:hypothetical protein [Paenibacillus sp. GbtcB18]|uniref:hypothetical protein n=1 Tax=Paenibacillus sp. GbtcB18 TaxID=2824763 RepID=UPI001C303408|nr:hypothetical protein [Paenibacillus sp. GbtcB18]
MDQEKIAAVLMWARQKLEAMESFEGEPIEGGDLTELYPADLEEIGTPDGKEIVLIMKSGMYFLRTQLMDIADMCRLYGFTQIGEERAVNLTHTTIVDREMRLIRSGDTEMEVEEEFWDDFINAYEKRFQ